MLVASRFVNSKYPSFNVVVVKPPAATFTPLKPPSSNLILPLTLNNSDARKLIWFVFDVKNTLVIGG